MVHRKNKRNCKGSLTVECALVFPLFLYAMIAVMYFFQIYHLHDMLQQAITKEGLNIARYGYVYQYIKDYEGKEDSVKDSGKRNTEFSGEAAGAEPEDSENKLSDTLKDLLVTKSINAAYFHLKLSDYVEEDYINKSIIEGGMEGVSTYLSDFMGEDDRIDIILSYYLKPPVTLFAINDFFILQRVTLRGWNGYYPDTKEENAEEEDTGYVYITENGSVYHLWEDCTYLKISVRETYFSNIGNLRNLSGGKYYPCELCKNMRQTSGTVYITDTGDRYHGDINCSALKRTVLKIPLSEAGSRGLCKRCQKKKK
ncbi:TadE-like protein [Anaerocolumna xylanovorans DSM 12503]|uniref:TadE-like protein n=2 Tax=Anaerocolumna TaxID=1843210 RepID=A0A1M7YMH7_9FIRM|nr:TadE-like protein [Anaerocolumna xylanovorans DSM 12503]